MLPVEVDPRDAIRKWDISWLNRIYRLGGKPPGDKEQKWGIVITDKEARILWVNDVFTEITGYQAWEVIGKNPNILQSGYHDRKFYEQMWKSIARTGKWAGEIWDLRKDQTVYPGYLSITAIKDPAGDTVLYAGFFRKWAEPLKPSDFHMLIPDLKREECDAAI